MRLLSLVAIVVVVASQLDSSAFADHQFSNGSYQTDSFTFKVPEPWYYATPKSDGRNRARCLLNSRFLLWAEGLVLVDAGKPVNSVEETVAQVTKVMQRGLRPGQERPIAQSDGELGGAPATVLSSQHADYKVPCTAIVCQREQRLYLLFISVSKPSQLVDRDAMLDSIQRTWLWR